MKLQHDPQYSTPVHEEWMPAPMEIDVNGAHGTGNVLMDTGVGLGFLTPPAGAIPSLVACPSGGFECAPDGTHIAVSLPGQTGETAFYRFDVGVSNPTKSVAVIVVDGSSIFFNTSRYVLQGLDYIYDATNGFVGYRWKNTAGTDGFVNVLLALQDDFKMPAGFVTSMPVVLFGDTRFIPEGTAEFTGVISGSQKLTIDGPGRVILSADNTFTPDAEVKSGMLSINGSVASRVVVDAGGTLGGTGHIDGDVVVRDGGTYAPGNSIGHQVLNAALHFDPGAVFGVEVNAAGQSDEAEVHGAVTLTGATLQVIVTPGSYNPTTSYLVIDNRGGAPVNGQFAQVTTDLAFFMPSVDYSAGTGDDVELTLVRSTDFAAVAQTPNQAAVALALETLPIDGPLVSSIQFQTLAGALQAFDALSGEVHATTMSAVIDQSRYIRQALLGRLQQSTAAQPGAAAASLPVASPFDIAAMPAGRMALGAGSGDGGNAGLGPHGGPADLVFWSKAYGAWGNYSSDGNAAPASRTLAGSVSGADARIGGGWRTGFATGYSQSSIDVNARASSSNVDTVHVAGYAGGPVGGGMIIRSGAAWGWNTIDASRAVVFPGFFESESASYNGDIGQAFAEIALPQYGRLLAAEPFADIAHVRASTSAFQEGGAVAGLVSSGSSDSVDYTTLGLRLASLEDIYGVAITTRASVAWQHAFGDVTPQAALAFASGGQGFVISGAPLATDSALIEGGLGVALSPQAQIEVSYYGQLASIARDNAVEGRFNWNF